MKEELKKTNPDMTIALNVNGVTSDGPKLRYTLSVLQEKDPEKLPSEVDPVNKEAYLHDSEFERVFNMQRSAYEALPVWKRQELKKKVGLF